MTTTLTTNFSLPIPPLGAGGTTDGYGTLLQTADTAIKNASGKGAWTDYSATSTIVGWASFVSKVIWYKQVGNIVFVSYALSGTSNSNTTSFTIPIASVFLVSAASGYTVDNSITEPSGYITINLSSNVVNLFRYNTSVWTTSNNKAIYGQFFYEVA